MVNKANVVKNNEYKSIGYLNVFRLLLSFFFILIVFKEIRVIAENQYSQNIAHYIATSYVLFAVIIWLVSFYYKSKRINIGLVALIIDLPFIISLALLVGGLNSSWVILAVITIGSFSIISHKSWSIFAMPIFAVLLLFILPELLGLKSASLSVSNLIMYAFTYFAIAFLGIRQSQSYNQSVLLTNIQRKKITDLSLLNSMIIKQMQSAVVAYNQGYEVVLINQKAQGIIKTKTGQLLPPTLINKIDTLSHFKDFTTILYGEELLINITQVDIKEKISLMFLEKQNEINAKAQQANLATIGKLSATIAHELRNPLAAIYSSSELLQESDTIASEDAELLEIIISQIKRSNSIIEDILMMSKPHVAKQVKIDLSQELERFKKHYCEQKEIGESIIDINITHDLCFIKFDKSHLNQLFWNLTENALKHGDGYHVSIEVNLQTNYVLIDFINKGDVFSAHVEERLFEPFFTTHTKGTGLGLFICQEMCKSNNAKLEYLRPENKHIFRIHVKKES